MKNVLTFILFMIVQINLFTQENIQDLFNEDTLNVLRFVENNRRLEQAGIQNYNDLQGTFWVADESHTEDINLLLPGFIFLPNNYLLVVHVRHSSDYNEYLELSIKPPLDILFINYSVEYAIIDNKIVVDNEIFCYLENSFLFFKIFDNYIKYRLENRFSIYNN